MSIVEMVKITKELSASFFRVEVDAVLYPEDNKNVAFRDSLKFHLVTNQTKWTVLKIN
jgi:hypothetical protein